MEEPKVDFIQKARSLREKFLEHPELLPLLSNCGVFEKPLSLFDSPEEFLDQEIKRSSRSWDRDRGNTLYVFEKMLQLDPGEWAKYAVPPKSLEDAREDDYLVVSEGYPGHVLASMIAKELLKGN
jgi:hypothetical protein